jgi:ketosteroid isomerase-like protein
MSRENVELVRRANKAWNEIGPDSLKQFWAEDGEWHDPPNLPDSRVVRGRDAVAAYLTDQATVIGDMKFALVDVRERGQTVVLRTEMTVHGPESGIDVPGEMAQVIEVVDGMIQRVRNFRTWDSALEAAGLEE